MNIDDITIYFEDYLESFAPYTGDNLYRSILDFLIEWYEELYINQPEPLKKLFEESIIIDSVYDEILIGIGLPNSVVQRLSFSERVLFLRFLADFKRYQGTLSFVQQLAGSFNDSFNVYELYIDWLASEDRWILRPLLVYRNPELDLYDDVLDYINVYNTVPSLLVSAEQLTNQREDNQLVLPIKSNMLLLDYDLFSMASLSDHVIFTTFLREFRDEDIDIFFDGAEFTISLSLLYFTWYYLVTRYFDTVWTTVPLILILGFDYRQNFNITLEDTSFPSSATGDWIEDGVSEASDELAISTGDFLEGYDAIDSREEFLEFYNRWFKNKFKEFFRKNSYDTHETMFRVINMLKRDFATYIDDRINDSNDSKETIRDLLEEILASIDLKTHRFQSPPDKASRWKRWIDLFISYLPQVVLDPRDTTTYLMLQTLKPYHVELIPRAIQTVRVEDKFNTIYFDEYQTYYFKWTQNSALGLEATNFSFYCDYSVPETVVVGSALDSTYFRLTVEEEIIEEEVTYDFTYPHATMLSITDVAEFESDVIDIIYDSLPFVWSSPTADKVTAPDAAHFALIDVGDFIAFGGDTLPFVTTPQWNGDPMGDPYTYALEVISKTAGAPYEYTLSAAYSGTTGAGRVVKKVQTI